MVVVAVVVVVVIVIGELSIINDSRMIYGHQYARESEV